MTRDSDTGSANDLDLSLLDIIEALSMARAYLQSQRNADAHEECAYAYFLIQEVTDHLSTKLDQSNN